MDKKKLVDESIDYIMQHLDEGLTLDGLADYFYISKYHYSRLFKEETGETVYAFIKRCKVDQSAVDMKLNPWRSITDVGLDYGYSASNYSSLFRKQRDISPAMFKQSLPTDHMPVPFTPQQTAHFRTAEEYAEYIDIQEFQDFFVLYERHKGNYYDIEKNWYQFMERYRLLLNENSVMIERFFHDPSVTDAAQCIYDLCMTVGQDCREKNVTRIGGGKWIVYHYDGAIRDIFETLQGIFSVWMPQSGYSMAKRYGLNIYRQIERENHHVVMDLCIPI